MRDFTIFTKPLQGVGGQELNVIVSEQAEQTVATPVTELVAGEAPVVEEVTVLEENFEAEEAPAAEVDTSFLDEMTKKELLSWSEEQGWDLVNGKLKSEILAECKEIALGTFVGTPLA